jgi:zinc transport system substrate-binding protein
MFKKHLVILLSLFILILFSACNDNDKNLSNSIISPRESKVKVSVSIDAMKEFVQAVGKDKVEISTIISTGANTHDFEPKAQDILKISNSDIFVYNGLGMETWAEKAISAANNPSLIVVDSSKDAEIIERKETGESNDHKHEEDYSHSHGNYDPHLWLSLKGAQSQVKNIKDALIQANPSNKDYYEENYNKFIYQLEKLYNEYNIKFQSLEKNTLVSGHAAFAYLCRDFNLEQNSIRDVFAEGEPSAKQLAELVEYCRDNNVKTIFSEDMVSPEVSETLANEVGAKVEIIYTIEYPQGGMTYLERMESNLSKIYESLVE